MVPKISNRERIVMKKILEELSEVKVSDLERKGKDFSFSDVQKLNVFIFEKIKILQENPDFIAELPGNKRSIIENYLTNFLYYVKQIQNFNPSEGNPQDTRNSIAREINSLYETFYEHLFPYLDAFLSRKADPVRENLLKEAEVTVSEIEIKRQVVDEVLQEAEKILEALRSVSAKTGVSNFAEVFDEQAEQNKKTAKRWLIVSIVSAGVILISLYLIFGQLTSALENDIGFEVSLQIFFAKLLIFSFLSVVFYQVVKNYNANMHLYALNKHRQNSLMSFQAFVESTEDPKIRDAVLIQATRAIFEAGETGYVSSKDVSTKGLEMIKIADQIKE